MKVTGEVVLGSLFANGTREVYWTNGVRSEIDAGRWWSEDDRVCLSNEKHFERKCYAWWRNGDRIDVWAEGENAGYFFVLE